MAELEITRGGSRMPDDAPSNIGDLNAAWAQHRPRLLTMLRKRIDPRLGARVDSDDILSETYLLAQKRWAAFAAQQGSAIVWLYRLATDCLIEAWRRENRAKRSLQAEMPWPERSSMQLCLGLVAAASSPSRALARRERVERLRRILALLRPGDHQVLWLRHADGLTFPEIAEFLGVTRSAASVRYVRALARLRELCQEIGLDKELEP